MKRMCLLVLALGIFSPVIAQQYPTKPIRFVVPYAPGGNTDVLARLIGQRLADTFPHPVIVDNRPGIDGVEVLMW